MKVTKITNTEFTAMVLAASQKLDKNAEFINSLNVFPVPDGDTGTNMNLSLRSGYKYVNESVSTSVSDLANALAKGLLMGARGNSGVILSQIFRGFSKSTEGKTELSAQDLADGFIAATETAYKAVMKPTEGTVLTVVRLAAQAGKKAAGTTDDATVVMDAIYENAKDALAKTPDLLPVLKQVGVVDSGGQGLTFVLEAFDDVLNGKTIDDEAYQPDSSEMDEMIDATHHQSVQSQLDPDDIVYGYCTEIMVRIGRGKQVDHKFDYQEFYDYLAKLGDSLLVVNDDEIVKVHVHTEHPGKVMAWGQEFGDLAKVKVDNMRMQQETIIENDDQPAAPAVATEEIPDTAVISIASGKGIAELFKSLGVTNILSGGQTMNPSTEDIVKAIEATKAKRAIVLPNNKNIFLAAEQAAKVAKVPVEIVHSQTISQGITSMLGFNPDASLADNKSEMEANLDTVVSGQVTNAIRDTEINDVQIKKGQFMGIIDGKIKLVNDDLLETTVSMIKDMLDDDSEAITIIWGEGASADSAQKVADAIEEFDDELEVEVHEGDQPVYPFLVSVE
ncbi:DAK2 domain-containing protein [Lentilactobacillus sp. SPB1-3]|uniref:DAK2 domain-containing protein n=1 Tax=Lentilactobacillus terminaliae TaxID=3003483 RepID=A0ACD5DCD8_9LACO|nr:DAK2 domain-containing protein [Lentilactobacillus sp. SPB1-3]MCZ0977176.1 DAK2 domain-containing protein [Lentilactobacillus sp. SPB1-3]